MDTVAQTNSSAENLHIFGTKVFVLCTTSTFCCLFFVINGTILFVLLSKPVFYQCPRYVLLFNLVLADTMLMAQAQTLYFIAFFKVPVSYPVCISLGMISYLTSQISPYTLIFMSLERCIAVCFPFRHSTIATLRNTFICIFMMWTVSSADVLTRILILLQFPLHDLPTLMMPKFCSKVGEQLKPRPKVYETTFTYILFIFSSLIISCSFVAVMVVARSASTDQSSTNKTKKTLLLHMFQLVLNLITTLNDPLFTAVPKSLDPLVAGQLYGVIYILVILSPRCVSALTYGLRDSQLRPLLLSYLCVRLGPIKLRLTLQRTAKVY